MRSVATCSRLVALALSAAVVAPMLFVRPARADDDVVPDGTRQVSARTSFPEFECHRIDTVGRKLGQTSLVDIDRDGDLDWIAGEASHGGRRIWWWEFVDDDRWMRHSIGKGDTDVGGATHDVDGDGWPDMLSGSRLFLNTGNPRETGFRSLDVGTISSHDTEFVDIDGDGKKDVLANSDRAGLFWYSIPRDPAMEWARHVIADASTLEIHGGVSPRAVGDLDGDGDGDVVTARAWYENRDGRGLSWTEHRTIDFGERQKFGIAVRTWVVDLDRDGDLDFVQTEADHPDGRVAWFANDGKGRFVRHVIKDRGDRQDFHSLVVADFDLDGDQDVFSGGGPLSEKGQHTCYIWENSATADGQLRWVEHIVARKPCHEAVGGDVDGDGDVDICSKPWSTGNEHFFLKNLAREGAATPRSGGGEIIFADDFDREDADTVGNGWSTTGRAVLKDRAARFDVKEEEFRPRMRHAFPTQTTGKFTVTFKMDWLRTSEGTWGLSMQLGNSAAIPRYLIREDDLARGISVNLLWGGGEMVDFNDRGSFGYLQDGKFRNLFVVNDNKVVDTVVESPIVRIDVDIDSSTFTLRCNGTTYPDLPFDNKGPIDTIRFITNGCSATGFSRSSIDDVLIRKAR